MVMGNFDVSVPDFASFLKLLRPPNNYGLRAIFFPPFVLPFFPASACLGIPSPFFPDRYLGSPSSFLGVFKSFPP